MTRYSGVIGYAEEAKLVDGVWEDNEITERRYFGSVERLSRSLQNGSRILPDITVSNTISIVADAYAYNNFSRMRYIVWENTPWEVASVEVRHPRLIITLGGVYNGPTAGPSA